jgi:hypothetical protein
MNDFEIFVEPNDVAAFMTKQGWFRVENTLQKDVIEEDAFT